MNGDRTSHVSSLLTTIRSARALCDVQYIEAIGPLRKAPSESEYSSDVLDKALFCADLIKDADQYFHKEMLARYETSRMVSKSTISLKSKGP